MNYKNMIDDDRLELLMRTPFYGRIIYGTEVLFVDDPKVDLACNDCRRIYLSMKTYPTLPQYKRLAVLAHEVLHIVLCHAFRIGLREEKKFSFAADAEIFFLLEEHFDMEPDMRINRDWKGLTAEEIYDRLPKNMGATGVCPFHVYPNRPGDAPSMQGQANQDCESNDETCESKNNNSSDGNSNGDSAGKSGATQKQDAFDAGLDDNSADNTLGHNGIAADAIQTDEAAGTGSGDNPVSDFLPSFDRETEMYCRTLQAATQTTCPGTVPAEVLRQIEKIEQAHVNWRALLRQFLRVCRGGSYRWFPPNRRFISRRLYLPGRSDKELKAVVVLDTSGSTVEAIPDFVSELTGLLQTSGKYHLTVIECDCRVQAVWDISSVQRQKLDLAEYSVRGGGGTDFHPALEYIAEHIRAPEVVIFFTDGYGPCSDIKPPYPVVWMLTEDGKTPVSWGYKIHYKSKGE